jgi:hypothetical protein
LVQPEKTAGHEMGLITGPGCAEEISGGMIIAWLASGRRHEIPGKDRDARACRSADGCAAW